MRTLWKKGKAFRFFGSFFGSLGALGSLLGHFLEPLGHLGADFDKQLQKVAQKELKKGVPQTPLLRLFRKIGFVFFYYEKYTKTAPKKHLLETSILHRKCLQSVAPAMLLALSDNIESKSGINLNNAFCSRLPYFGSFFTLQRPQKTSKKHSERTPRMEPNGGDRRL